MLTYEVYKMASTLTLNTNFQGYDFDRKTMDKPKDSLQCQSQDQRLTKTTTRMRRRINSTALLMFTYKITL